MSDDEINRRLDRIEKLLAELEKRMFPQPYFPAPYGQHTARGCHVCGRGADGKSDWYVCNRSDCPNRIT